MTNFLSFRTRRSARHFLVLFQGRLILVSAKHCFENNRIEGHEVRIPDGGDDDAFLLFDRLSQIQPAQATDDKDFADIVLMRVKPGTVSIADIAARKVQVFPITKHLVVRPDSPRIQSFILRGFPLDLNAVDHEAQRIPKQSLTVFAKYTTRDGGRYVHVLEVADYAVHTSGNGMSGGAVIALVKDNQTIHAKLAGIIIRGLHGSRFARVIDARVLLYALEQSVTPGIL